MTYKLILPLTSNKEVSRTVQLRQLCVKFAEVASRVGVTIIKYVIISAV